MVSTLVAAVTFFLILIVTIALVCLRRKIRKKKVSNASTSRRTSDLLERVSIKMKNGFNIEFSNQSNDDSSSSYSEE